MEDVEFGHVCNFHQHVRLDMCAGSVAELKHMTSDQESVDSSATQKSAGMLLPAVCYCCHRAAFDSHHLLPRTTALTTTASSSSDQQMNSLVIREHRKHKKAITPHTINRLKNEKSEGNMLKSIPIPAPPTPAPAPIHNDNSHLSISRTPLLNCTSQNSNSKEDIYIQAVIAAGLIPTAAYALTALMTAAMNEDIEAIKVMAKEEINPNVIQDETGYAALHHAVIARKYRSVLAILTYFTDEIPIPAYTTVAKEKQKKGILPSFRPRHVMLNVNQRDFQGDSALHLAIRRGTVDIVEAICADNRCCPGLPKNLRNELETDICFHCANRNVGHEMWQLVQNRIQKNDSK
jgi:hypothetical protein